MPQDQDDRRAVGRLMVFFAVAYVVEGIGQARYGIVYQPLSYFLKESGWTPLEVTAYFSVLNFPWVIKPVYGLVSDFVPILGYRRKSYLILAGLCAAGAYAGVVVITQPRDFAPLLVLTAYSMATASTLCGALLAENGRTFHQSSLFVSQQWLWFNIAVMVSALLGGELVQHLAAETALQSAAGIAAVAPLAVVAGALFLLKEPRAQVSRQAFVDTLHGIATALKSRRLYLVAFFLFLYAFAPGFGTPLYYYMSDKLGFSQAYIGILGSISSAGWIAGGLLHRWLLYRMSARALLVLSIVLGTLTAAAYLLLSDELSAALVQFASGVAAMIATIASLTVAARACPERAEGFAFAGLMSVSNLADICSTNAGAYLYERVFDSQLAPLIVVSAATTAVALVLVPLLKLDERE
jgi:predicted MFS family arabinose efflux permease